tara:strand:- start:248 stop:1669 length:1422 start_codon:yes stop_codon:yes gene_type:complete
MKNTISIILIFCFSISIKAQSIYDDLSRMDKEQLQITRNTVFAKHGREFVTSSMKEYFNSKIWYKINPNYSDDMLTDEDHKLIDIIKIWESSVLLKKINLSKLKIPHGGNHSPYSFSWESSLDEDYLYQGFFYVLLDKNNKSLFLLINDAFVEISISQIDMQISEINFNGVFGKSGLVFDIVRSDNCKVGSSDWGYQNICDWNYILVTFQNGNFEYKKVSEWISEDTDKIFITGGFTEVVTVDGTVVDMDSYRPAYFVFEQTYCDWDKGKCLKKNYYDILENGSIIASEILEFCYSGAYRESEICSRLCSCAACFDEDSKILINEKDVIPIKDLQVGSVVLSYDIDTKKYNESTVLEIIKVQHNNLVELYFNHDTIISTNDHPYYVVGKKWSSFNPTFTEFNYLNYDKVHKIEAGDMFVLSNGEYVKLLGFSILDDSRETYTITKLDKGNTFFINGILVGVESIRSQATKNEK